MFSNKSVFNAFAVSCHLSEAKTTLDSALRLRRPQKDGFNNALDGSKRFLIRNLSFVIRNSSFVIRHWSEAPASETSAKVFNSSFFIRHWSEAPASETSAKVFNSSFSIRNLLVPRTGVSFVIRHWSEATLDRQTDRQTDLSPSEENFCVSCLSFNSKIPVTKNKIANVTAC